MLPIHKCLAQFGLCLILSVLPSSFMQAEQDLSSDPGLEATRASGRSTFNSSCAGCHGLDGRGSDKAANIATSDKVQHLSDAQLASIISNGVPEAGMPAFHNLNEKQVLALVDYLRSLQGKGQVRTLPGDAKRGKEIFFEKGDCASCHTISGKGGFLGPDLSDHAADASAETLREEIIRSPRVPPMGYRAARLTTTSGHHLEGLVRNEDNFSVQLQTKDGSFHFLKKAELQSFEYLKNSLMPENYRERLTDSELRDLVSYLMVTVPAGKTLPSRKKKEEDAE